MDFNRFEAFPRKNRKSVDRTLNRHRWVSRVDSGAWENYVEGTRQIDSVTSGEGVLVLAQAFTSVTKSGGTTS
jgi:hypothetical protein